VFGKVQMFVKQVGMFICLATSLTFKNCKKMFSCLGKHVRMFVRNKLKVFCKFFSVRKCLVFGNKFVLIFVIVVINKLETFFKTWTS